MRHMMVVVIALLCWLVSIESAFSAVDVTVDRSPIHLNESFSLTFRADQDVDVDPDFSVLNDYFEIINQSRRSNIQITNGSMSRAIIWTISLMPKKAGSFMIPPILFDTEYSSALRLEVLPAQKAKSGKGGEEIFVTVQADPEKPYVQSQVLYTVRLFRRVELAEASLNEPEIDGTQAVVQKLGDDHTFNTSIGNRNYRVTERKYVIFPQKSGKLSIAPMQFKGRVVTNRRASMFDPFGRSGSIHRVMSDPIELDVQPIPMVLQGQPWLPANVLKLTAHWPGGAGAKQPRFQVGEPVTRTITVQAEGLTAAQLPALMPDLPDGLKGFPDQPVLEDRPSASGITGIRQEKIAIIPAQAGSITLPAMALSWWNLQTNQLETTEIPAEVIEVIPAVNQPQTAMVQPVQPPQQIILPNQDKPTETPEDQKVITKEINTPGYWPYVALICALGWVLSLYLLWHQRRYKTGPVKPRAKAIGTIDKKALIQAEARLKEACRGQQARELKEALLVWGQAFWPEDPPLSLGALSMRTGEPLTQALQSLGAALYSGQAGDSNWQGEKVWEAISSMKKSRSEKSGGKKDGLAPLYPGE
ncbi:MAG: protein BatD [Magnetococcales bacterium]|nr:protein BatD [Magnetococcales bacterium]